MKRASRRSGRTKPALSIQYTVRAVPPDVDRALREKAKAGDQSLNDVLLDALRNAAGANGQMRRYHDLDHLAGSMPPDPELDRILDEMRVIDEDMWR